MRAHQASWERRAGPEWKWVWLKAVNSSPWFGTKGLPWVALRPGKSWANPGELITLSRSLY